MNPQKSFGKTSKIWVSFAKYYEKFGELNDANLIFHKASLLEFKQIEELAFVYCSWAEMHVRNENIDSAIEIMKYACTRPRDKKQLLDKHKRAGVLSNNLRAQSLYLDLLENYGTFEEAKQVY